MLPPACCLLLALVLVGLAGCQARSQAAAVPFEDAPAFSPSPGAEVVDRWWVSFADEALNERVESALAGNLDLAALWERLGAARAVARRAEADLYPGLDATAGASRDESLDSADDQTRLSLGLAASYEVDLWGRIDSIAQAEALRARATEADYRAAAISLSSELSLVWYEIALTRAQLDIVSSQLEVNQTFQSLLEERFDFGQIRRADVVRQRQLVEATREQAILQRARLDVLEHRLAVLEGRPPQSADATGGAALPELPPGPGVGVPSTLLASRPDVQGALLRLRAADREVAAAVSDQYPRLNLTASLETAAERPADLFERWLLSVTGEAVAPLLDGGERRAEVDRTESVLRQRIAEYGQTVLLAFGEVEDALALEARRAERLASLREQLRLGEQAVEQLRTQFLNGDSDYLAVLEALRDKQQLERDVVAARFDLISARIALYRSLAGGFSTPREQADDAKDSGTAGQDQAQDQSPAQAPGQTEDPPGTTAQEGPVRE